MVKTALFSAKLQVKKSPIHGYGVFAQENLYPNDLIEECYVIFPEKNHDCYGDYQFQAGDAGGLLLGFGCIYNHSKNPNADYIYDSESSVCQFKAIRPIQCDEEILISYGKDWFSSRHMQLKEYSFGFAMRKLISSSLVLFRFCLVSGVLLLMPVLFKTWFF